jgi:hypothetical protein
MVRFMVLIPADDLFGMLSQLELTNNREPQASTQDER